MNAHTPTPGSVKPLNTRQLAKAATRAKVLGAAKTCFDLLGYERADIRSIADYARVSTGAIFGNFSGKAEIYREIYGLDPISPEVGRELLIAAQLTEQSEDQHANCDDCGGEGEAEACQTCLPLADEARLARRAAIALATSTPSAQTEAA